MKTKISESSSFVPLVVLLGAVAGLAVIGLVSWLGAGILASACVGRGEFVWSRAEYLSE